MALKIVKEIYSPNCYSIAFEPSVSFEEGMQILHSSGHPLASALIDVLKSLPFDAYFFEMAPVNNLTADTTRWEALVTESFELAQIRKADQNTFEEKFGLTDNDIVVFPNLGGDATLVVPKPLTSLPLRSGPGGSLLHYAHLASFLRAPATQAQPQAQAQAQAQALLSTLAREALAALEQRQGSPLWVSTSGLGVSWLHFRLDSRPKYYQQAAFKVWPFPAAATAAGASAAGGGVAGRASASVGSSASSAPKAGR